MKILKDDAPCIDLLGVLINPCFRVPINNEKAKIRSKYLISLIEKLKIVFKRSPSKSIFDNFINKIMGFFKNKNTYHDFHKFVILITRNNEEVKFLLSFLNSNILYERIDFQGQCCYETKNEESR